MTKAQRRSRWRVHLSASEAKVRFSIQGQMGRRAVWLLAAVIAIILCALLAPDMMAEIARLLKTISP